jgi:hypothetical protein
MQRVEYKVLYLETVPPGKLNGQRVWMDGTGHAYGPRFQFQWFGLNGNALAALEQALQILAEQSWLIATVHNPGYGQRLVPAYVILQRPLPVAAS